MYAKITDDTLAQYPYTPDQLCRDNPNTAFGAVLSAETLAAFGVVQVTQPPAPAYNALTQKLTEETPVLGSDGWISSWRVEEMSEQEITVNTATANALHRAAAKVTRTDAVSRITVTTAAGNTFDGDETSQNRMARAILALQATNTPATLWVLSDNTVIEASVAELAEALALSGAAQSSLWVIT